VRHFPAQKVEGLRDSRRQNEKPREITHIIWRAGRNSALGVQGGERGVRRLRCGGRFNDHFIAMFFFKYASERLCRLLILLNSLGVVFSQRLQLFFYNVGWRLLLFCHRFECKSILHTRQVFKRLCNAWFMSLPASP